MNHYHFTCRLLSEVIISSSSATEGFHPSLHYIPGSKFWGIAAKALYGNDTQQTIQLFHSGDVCCGDAHLAIDGGRSRKIPLSWLQNKDNPEEGIYIHHKVDYKQLTIQGIQLEQHPTYYFNEKGLSVKPQSQFSIKSAYDSQLRRSEDEKMYGYYALPAGSIWKFSVSSASLELLEIIKSVLEGKKRIGRSKSAQYGLAELKFKRKNQEDTEIVSPGIHYLYAESAIMLPLEITFANALVGATIVFDKSKIRHLIYQSWNTHRHARDMDRQIIDKGSVIAIDVPEQMHLDTIVQRLLERRAEGFGKFLLDPPFLMNVKEGHLAAINLHQLERSNGSHSNSYIEAGEKDQKLIELLKERQSSKQLVENIGYAVNQFVVEQKRLFASVSSSQWGTVRSFAKMFSGGELHRHLLDPGNNGDKKGYLVSGIAEEKWRRGRYLIEEILDEDNEKYPKPRHLFLEKLAAEMAKVKQQRETE